MVLNIMGKDFVYLSPCHWVLLSLLIQAGTCAGGSSAHSRAESSQPGAWVECSECPAALIFRDRDELV